MGGGAFSSRSDFDPATGGVNPVLGLASGGMYASGGFALARDLKMSFGFSQKTDNHTYYDPAYGQIQTSPLPTNRASASVGRIDYAVTEDLALDVSYTGLSEANGLLGSQGTGAFSLAGGARTQGTTFGATATLPASWTISASATLAHTTTQQNADSGLTLGRSGLASSAFELAVAKTGLMSDVNSIRLSLAQPLHVESGTLNYTSLAVTDRNTGAVGPVTQSWGVGGNRELRMEAVYRLPVLDNRAAVEGFSLLDMNSPMTPDTKLAVTVGGQIRFGF